MAGCTASQDTTAQEPPAQEPPAIATSPDPTGTGSVPALTVETILDDLDHPWDVVVAPDGTLLTGERGGRFVALRPGGEPQQVGADLDDLFVGSETGLMAIALAPDFATSRTVYTCQGSSEFDEAGGPTDIRVVAWTVDDDWTDLTRVRTVIDGFPIRTGRHGGCRILARPDGTLWIGTGDSAQPSVPQDPDSLGGKVLRVDAASGDPAPGNPDPDSPVYTLGHRNVQGLGVRPGTDQVFSVEQGPDRDDEVEPAGRGRELRLAPRPRPGRYDESVPMTDPERVPGAVAAVWSTGSPTLATASGTFVTGTDWGDWDGALALGALKGQRVVLLRLSPDGTSVLASATPPELAGTLGRIRTVAAQPDGSLLLTTDNGDDDRVVRVRPTG